MSTEGKNRSVERAVQPGDGPSTFDKAIGHDSSTAHRLYDLLDTLVAMRMDFEVREEGMPGAFKTEEIRAILDHAIASTKDIISDIVRPRLDP